MAFPREANTVAERDAAEKRARVAAAVSKQEWLDRTEVKFGGVGSRAISGTDDEPTFDDDDDDEKADLLTGMPPPADPTFADKARSWSWLWGVGIFAVFMVGAVLLFWDDMHVKKVSGRPEVPGAAIENVKEEAEEFGTTVTELAAEIQEEAQEASRETAAAAAGEGGDAPASEDNADGEGADGGASAAEDGGGGGDDGARRLLRRRRRLTFADKPARRFLTVPADE